MSEPHFPHEMPEEALDLVIAAVGGTKPAVNELALAAWQLSGYVLYKTVGCPDHPMPVPMPVPPTNAATLLTPEAQVRLLNQLRPSANVKGVDIPWRLLWEILKQVIEKNLPM